MSDISSTWTTYINTEIPRLYFRDGDRKALRILEAISLPDGPKYVQRASYDAPRTLAEHEIFVAGQLGIDQHPGKEWRHEMR